MHGPQWRHNSVSAYFCAYAYFHIFLCVFFGVFVDFVYVCVLFVRSRLRCWGGRLTSVAAQFLFVFSLYLCAFLICFPISVFWWVCGFCVDFVLFVRSGSCGSCGRLTSVAAKTKPGVFSKLIFQKTNTFLNQT